MYLMEGRYVPSTLYVDISNSVLPTYCTQHTFLLLQALNHIKEKVIGLANVSSLDLLNYPGLDHLISDDVDRMAVCQLWHWTAVKYSHRQWLKATTLQKVISFALFIINENFHVQINKL